MSNEKEKVESLLSELPDAYTLILKEILQEEKNYLYRKNLQGTSIVNDIVNIIKERIRE